MSDALANRQKETGSRWFPHVPSHWDIVPFKRLVDIRNGRDHKEVEQDYGYPVLGSGGVFAHASDYLYDGEAVLLGRKGTIDRPQYFNGRFWAVDTMYWGRIRKGIHGRFSYYAAQTIPFNYYKTSTALPSMTKSILAAHKIGLPPSSEQKAIADFLDRETARIDDLVKKKRQLVLAMDEKKRAFAAEASTRGLDPAARMQETGIEIVSEAPAHWEVMRVARVFREVAEKGIEGLPVLSVSINWGISDKELADEDRQRIVNQIADKTAYKRIRPNDLVYNMMRAWQGGFGVSRVEGLVSPAYVVARPHREIHAAYYEHLLRTPMWIEEFRRASKGIADFRQRLYWEHFRLVPILVPPLHEQKQIAAAIAANNARLDRVAEKVSESINYLTELRASLITAAVSGQIDTDTYRRNDTTDRAFVRIAEEMAQ